MNTDFQEVIPPAGQGTEPAEETAPVSKPRQNAPSWLEILARLGLGEIVARVGTAALTIILVIVVIWLMRLMQL